MYESLHIPSKGHRMLSRAPQFQITSRRDGNIFHVADRRRRWYWRESLLIEIFATWLFLEFLVWNLFQPTFPKIIHCFIINFCFSKMTYPLSLNISHAFVLTIPVSFACNVFPSPHCLPWFFNSSTPSSDPLVEAQWSLLPLKFFIDSSTYCLYCLLSCDNTWNADGRHPHHGMSAP